MITEDLDPAMFETNYLDRFVKSEAGREEQIVRSAILGTDWRETSVVRIITRRPGVQPYDEEEPFKIAGPSYEIERYADKAPPVSEHADGEHVSDIRTVTWPLLEALADEHEEFAEMLEVAIGPSFEL